MGDSSLRLLIELSRRPDGGSGDSREHLEDLVTQSDLDWNDVFMKALWHKVAFLSLQRLYDEDLIDVALTKGHMPLLVFNHWRQLHEVNRQRNRVLQEELRAITGAFDEEGVDYAVGKGGPLLIGRCYAPGERKMYDLDFLAHRDALDEIIRAMGRAGFRMGRVHYRRRVLEPLDDGELRKWLLLSRGLPNFVKLREDPLVDMTIAQVQFLVGSTASGGSVPAARLLARARTDEVGWDGADVRIRRPDDTDVSVQLALHIARETRDAEHREWRMSWNLIKLCDLDRFVCRTRPTPALLADRCAELGFLSHCLYALRAVQAVFPSDTTAELIVAVESRRAATGSQLGQGQAPEPAAPEITEKTVLEGMSGLLDGALGARSAWTGIVGVKTS